MEFAILGPLVVIRERREIPIPAAKQRALLTLLLLRRGELVPTETLVDQLWQDEPPATAVKAVQVYVSQLRKALGDGAIATRPAGYVLRASADDVDAARFVALVELGRTQLANGDPEAAGGTLRGALALWRGPALAEFRAESFARGEADRLEELRLIALEQRLEADLECGRAAEVVPELEALMREHPLRESVRRQSMLALYRAGRQADALAVYQATRRTLVDELGLEPSESLRELETSILRHDPGLEASRFVKAPSSPPRTGKQRILVAAAAVAVAAGVAIATAVMAGGGGAEKAGALAGNSVGVYQPGNGQLIARVALGASPGAVAIGGGSLWVADVDAGTVTRINPDKKVAVQTIGVGHGSAGIAVGGGAVWVANSLDGTVSRIDEQTNDVVQNVRVGNRPTGVAIDGEVVWVADASDGTLTELDGKTGTVRGTITVGSSADDVAAGFGSLWVGSEATGEVTRIDRRTHVRVQTIPVGSAARAVAIGDGAVWVADDLDGTVSRIDPATSTIRATIPVGAGPDDLAVARDAVWVSNELSGTVSRIDPARDTVVQTLRTGARPEGLAVAGGKLLVAARTSGAGHRGGTLTVLVPGLPYTSLDPAAPIYPSAAVILTNDGLAGFRRVGGGQGTNLVPDLAVSLPAPTDDGRSYTFRLRPGLRYSDGSFVRPQDFRRAIERSLALNSVQGPYYASIVGAPRCIVEPKRPCQLARGIVTDPRSGTITFHLTKADPNFLYELALPTAYAVPAQTPLHIHGWVPATGPYRAVSFTPHRIRFERNPYFREWSAAAQPAGFPDAITITFQATPDIGAVLDGRSDIADIARPSPAALERLRVQHASQLKLSPWDITWFLVLNTRRSPFDDVRPRRALNFAVDRRRLLDLTLGHGLGQVTCQVLPPSLDGYRRFCPYTVDAGDGAWNGPNLRRARSLVRASGTAGQRVTLWIPRWTGFGASAGRYIVSVLDSIGYRARYRFSPDPYPQENKLGLQVGFYGWVPDYATPAGYIPPGLSCAAYNPVTTQNENMAEFCDHAIDRQMARAQALQTTDPSHASRAWTSIDRALTNSAPWVPFANGIIVSVISKRVGNYEYSPQWGTLFDQLWVK